MILENVDVQGEIRYQAIGYADEQLLAAVVYVDFTESEDAEIIHLISARKAGAPEELAYADQFA